MSWVWRCQEEAQIPSFPASGKPFQPRNGEKPSIRDPGDRWQNRPRGQGKLARRGAASRVLVRCAPIRSRLEADPLPCTQVLICTGCTSLNYSNPQIINGGGRGIAFPPRIFFSAGVFEPFRESPRCYSKAILLQCMNWTHKNVCAPKTPLPLR